MAPPPSLSPLTIQERILLTLTGYHGAREQYAVPREVTQAGIAAALGVRTGHISREVHKLLADGLVEERETAVEGSKRHQLAYFLTAQGALQAAKLKQERGEGGALPAPRGAAGGAGPSVRIAEGLPAQRYFFGREAELEAARGALGERAVLAVLGIAGIGKSTFGARLFEESAASRSVVWHQVREYDSAASVLEPVSRLLASLGRPRLELVLKREGPPDLARARAAMLQDVAGLQLTAFFDDVQSAGPEALLALRVLRESSCEWPENLKLVLLSRVRPPIYDAREVALRRRVAEIELAGLSTKAVEALLGVSKKPMATAAVFEMTGGHPLFIELVRDAGGPADGERVDRRHIDRFLHDEILSKLSEGALAVLRRIYFVRRPVDPRVLLAPPASLRDLIDLENRSLLRRDARGRVAMHEAVRDTIHRLLGGEEALREGRAVFAALHAESQAARRASDEEYAADLLESALSLGSDDSDRLRTLVELSRCQYELTQYGAAAEHADEALDLARRGAEGPSPLEVLTLLALILIEGARAGPAKARLEEAEALAAASAGVDEHQRGELRFARGMWEFSFGAIGAARTSMHEALATAKAAGDRALEAKAELLISHVTPAAESHRHLGRCIELAEGVGDRALASFAHSVFSWHLVHFSGDVVRALEHARIGLAIAEGIHNKALINWARVAQAKALWRAGKFGEALDKANEAMGTGDKFVSYQLYPYYLASLVKTDAGDPEGGEALARELIELASECEWTWAATAPRRALAHALDAQGKIDEAVPLLEEAHEGYARAAQLCDAGGDAVIVDRLVQIEAARGNRDRAMHWRGVQLALLEALEDPVAGAFLRMADGHMAAPADPAAAAALYLAAAGDWRSAGWRSFELRFVSSGLDLARRARASGGKWPAGVEQEAQLERRARDLRDELKLNQAGDGAPGRLAP